MQLKQIAVDFLKLSAFGKSREAFELYAANQFKHHNVFFPGDAHSLVIAMEENAVKFPDKTFEVQRVLEDKDLVAVHSRAQLNVSAPEIALIHIFRFENNKIAELWDFGQAVPSDIVNENGMF
jgi:predicted SnoaL-like aldol condensation-catalyzing enzyme